MASFIPLSFQKKLLRYALSRIDILDADALDLDRLEFGWRTESTIEVRNVALRKQKLAALLNLPSTLAIRRASVEFLKLTVPTNLYASSIKVSVRGVRVDVRTHLQPASQPASRSTEAQPSSTKASAQHGATEDHSTNFPTPRDLAQSFLDQEPADEKIQLEADLAVQPPDLAHSVASSEETEDGHAGYGFAGGFSLPIFLAQFINDIVSRLYILVEDVSISVQDYANPPLTVQEGEEVAICIDISRIESPGYSKTQTDPGPDDASFLAVNKGRIGKRLLVAKDTSMSLLLSDATLTKWQRIVGKGSLHRDNVSPTHSWSGPPYGESTQGQRDQVNLSAASAAGRQSSYSGQSRRDADFRAEDTTQKDHAASFHNVLGSFRKDRSHLAASEVTGRPHKPDVMSSALLKSQEGGFQKDDDRSSSSGTTGPPQDLLESQLFSSRQAESIYMSVLGDDATDLQRSQFTVGGLPANVRTVSTDSAHNSDLEPNSGSVSPGLGFDTGEAGGGVHARPKPRHSATSILLFSVESIAAWIPTESESLVNQEESVTLESPETALPKASTQHPYMPGAFSIHQDSNHLNSEPALGQGDRPSVSQSLAVEISVDNIVSSIDMSVCAIIYQLFGHFQENFLSPPKKPHERTYQSPAAETGPESRVELTVTSLRIALHDRALSTSESLSGHSQSPGQGLELIQLHLKAIRFHNFEGDGCASNLLQVRCFSMRVGGQDVLHFDNSSSLSSSLKAIQHPENTSVSVTWGSIGQIPQINVGTAPVRLSLDLRQLDESLATLGGLSGLFEASSVVISETTASRPTRAQLDSRPHQRTVHFDPLPQGPVRSSPPQRAQLKVNFRLDGLELDLKGSYSSVSLRTSAIKVVHRASIVGVQIDRMTLTGPRNAKAQKGSSAKCDVNNFGMKYLFMPEEQDLSRLVSLLVPSKEKFAHDDDLMVDTLVNQRRNGPVARLSCSSLILDVPNESPIKALADFGTDILRISNIKQYLPKESRPGLLLLGSIGATEVRVSELLSLGQIHWKLNRVEIAYVGSPQLIAFASQQVGLIRNGCEELLHAVVASELSNNTSMLMARYIGDALEPTWKVKLHNACFEYDAAAVSEIQRGVQQNFQEGKRTEQSSTFVDASQEPMRDTTQDGMPRARTIESKNTTRFGLDFRDCAIGLRPHGLPSKGIVILSSASFHASLQDEVFSDLQVRVQKGNVLLVDMTSSPTMRREQTSRSDSTVPDFARQPLTHFYEQGYVPVCWISAAEAHIRATMARPSRPQSIDVEFQDELFVLETCADSTQTLIELFGALQPPSSDPPIAQKFLTEVAPVTDMMASFTGDAFTVVPDVGKPHVETHGKEEEDEEQEDERYITSLEGLYQDETDQTWSSSNVMMVTSDAGRTLEPAPALEVISGGLKATSMPADLPADVCTWDSNTNRLSPVTAAQVRGSPCAIRVRNVHVIWNLHDGYDWSRTRETISKAVHDVESRAEGRVHRSPHAADDGDEDEPVINDFLFNSIYIGVPINQEPRELTARVNRNLDDTPSETISHASHDTKAAAPKRTMSMVQSRTLKLERSKRQKLTFELRDLSADFVLFAAESDNVSSTVINVGDLEIFDHVPTSTWKKFATYQQDAGTREDKKSMVKIEVCNVRPVPTLSASELVVRVTVLPLRLHIDQDALDFMTRFFEFKDGQAELKEENGSTYLQRVEVRPVSVKLDYKPKSVDYAGLRSGRTKEFMNFFNLDGADILLKHAIIYGCPNFARLHQNLEDIWMPDIKRNQLPNILSGLNGVRTVVNVGGGIRNLIVIPVQEYQRDGRIIRSIAKGASSFVRTSGSELTRFGARLAVGAQNALQGAEDLLTGAPQAPGFETDNAAIRIDSANEDDSAQILDYQRSIQSNFADQPAGILQGLKGAARSLERDLLLTRDVVIAVSGEVLEGGTAGGAARAMARNAPTLILRPMIGATKAISQTLMGVTNSVDPVSRDRLNDKYKRY